MDIQLASGVQHMPRTSAWSLVAAPLTDINIGSVSSTDHRHPTVFSVYMGWISTWPLAAAGLQTSTWPSLAIWTIDINKVCSGRTAQNINIALNSNTDHRHPHDHMTFIGNTGHKGYTHISRTQP